MKVTFWGTRGSFSRVLSADDTHFCHSSGQYDPENDFGGNTLCVEISDGDNYILVDAGSGLTRVYPRPEKEYHILFSHLHWDHMHSLNFFAPMFIPGHTVNLYGVHDKLEDSVRTLFNGVNFPIRYEDLQSEKHFHKLKKYREVEINTFKVTPFELDHPGKAYGYRIEKGGVKIATVFDTEFTRANEDELGKDSKYYDDLDLMIFDSQYDLDELVTDKMDWGHATPNFAVDIALNRNISKVALVHHDPWKSNEELAKRRERIFRYYEAQYNMRVSDNKNVKEVEIIYARDKLSIDV